MPEFAVICDEGKKARGINCWTFTVDGEPSMYWCPTEAAVNRVISRLKEGRSREAFGGTILVNSGGQIRSAGTSSGRGRVFSKSSEEGPSVVTMKSGKTKQREAKECFCYELDGKVCEEEFSSENEARAACALKAFMTRGKLGKISSAKAALQTANPGKECKVYACPETHRVVAEVEGKELHVGFTADGGVVFKLLEPKAG